MLLGTVTDQPAWPVLVTAEVVAAGNGILLTYDKPVTMLQTNPQNASLWISTSNYTGEYQILGNAALTTLVQQSPTQVLLPFAFMHIPSTATGILDVKITYPAYSFTNAAAASNVTVTNNSTFSTWTPLLERGIGDWGAFVTLAQGSFVWWPGMMDRVNFTFTSGAVSPITVDTQGVYFQSVASLHADLSGIAHNYYGMRVTGPFSLSLEQINQTANVKTGVGFATSNSANYTDVIDGAGAMCRNDGNLPYGYVQGFAFGNSYLVVNGNGTTVLGNYISMSSAGDGGASILNVDGTTSPGPSGTGNFRRRYLHIVNANYYTGPADSKVRFWKVNAEQPMDAGTEANWQAYIANVVANGVSVL